MILAFDVGKTGAVCVMDSHGEVQYLSAMPLNGGDVDVYALSDIITDWPIKHAYLEHVSAMPGQGVVAMFSFGRTLGLIEGLLATRLIPYTKVRPREWQAEIFSGVKIKKGRSKKEVKNAALVMCKRLFPKVNLLATERSKVPHQGIVDAILIGEYARRKFYGKG